MSKRPRPYGSISKFREFYIAFGYSDWKWTKYLKGYSHALLIEKTKDSYTCVDFGFYGCPIFILDSLPPDLDGRTDFIHFRVRRNRCNTFIKLSPFQTCATMIQIIAGFNFGVLLANSLHNRLTCKSDAWLKKRGVTLIKD